MRAVVYRSVGAQRSGMIINVASLTAEQGYPYNSVYASSKAAVALLSESLKSSSPSSGSSCGRSCPA